jgi:hypothetical protein
MNDKPYKKTQPAMTVYLGPEPMASERMEALNRIAGKLGVSRSKLICMIADGNLTVIVTPHTPDSHVKATAD